MTPVMTRRAFADLGAPDLVYVRPVKARDLLSGVDGTVVHAAEINPEQTFYAVYGADGMRLAVLAQRDEAFAAAVAHELAPVSVH